MKALLGNLIKRIKPKDGMRINAKIWQQAHDHHRHQQQAHALFGHGAGIMTGLEVKADEDPRSRRVWIQPGLAVMPEGQAIVLDKEDSHEVEADETGLVYLLLEGTGEGSPDKDYLVQERSRFKTATSLNGQSNAVELARVRLPAKGSQIKDAGDPAQPGHNEIDMRFRQLVRAVPQKQAAIAISYLGQRIDVSLPEYGPKASQLARTLSHLAEFQVWIDDDVPLTADLQPYDLLYLIERGPNADLEPEEIGELLRRYLNHGGAVFVESYPPIAGSRSIFAEIFKGIGVNVGDFPSDHPLLMEPFFFSAPPSGDQAQGAILFGNDVIYSTRDYGRLWQRNASSDGKLLSREVIRGGVEWATNLITFAVNHRRA